MQKINKIHQTLSFIFTLTLSLPIWATPPSLHPSNIPLSSSSPALIALSLKEIADIEGYAQKFQNLYTSPLQIKYPDTANLKKEMLISKQKMDEAESPKNRVLTQFFGCTVIFLTILGIKIYTYNPVTSSILGTIGVGIVSIPILVLGNQRYQKFIEYENIYSSAKQAYTAAKNKKLALYDASISVAKSHRSLSLKGFLNDLVKETDILYKKLENTPLHKETKSLVKKARLLKEGYHELDDTFKLTMPNNATLEEMLIPQYKTVTLTTTGTNTSSPPQQSSHSSQNNTLHHNQNNHDREKNHALKTEDRVLDEEKNAHTKQKVTTFKDFYKTLESIEPLCKTLKDKYSHFIQIRIERFPEANPTLYHRFYKNDRS